MSVTFSSDDLEYLSGQRLGRLSTVDPSGAPQNNPVGFMVDDGTGDILIGGLSMATTRKFRNVQQNPHVAFVVDDLVSTDPWRVRGVEVRGVAQALADVDPPMPGMSWELIRITPHWIGSWGISSTQPGLTVRK
ncbi:MAG: PPOX class F420-dependent oxidoreductase [Pseudonocardiaceae bacterium]